MPNTATSTWHKGGCHCGAVQFEVLAPSAVTLTDCNCSICTKSGYLHLPVEADQFKLIKGQDHLAEYRFNKGIARHYFCKTCGIKSFYVPRSNPDGYTINFHCLDRSEFGSIEIEPFDGQDYEASIENLNT